MFHTLEFTLTADRKQLSEKMAAFGRELYLAMPLD